MSPEARARPRAVVVAQKGALRLSAVNVAAAALGLEGGLALADARARHPDLDVQEADPEGAARMLGRLADACERYTPLIALDGPDGLLLDVTGCAHLFGGEEGLVRDLLGRVARSGFAGRAALAATADGAFALARFAAGRGGVVVPAAEDLAALLAPLPLAALRLDRVMVEALERLGFRQVGALYSRPRAPFAARFGAELLRRLDAALGRTPTAVDYRFPPPVFCAERPLAEPVEQVEDVLGLATHLATTLAGALERQGVGARRFDLTLFRVDGRVTRLAIGTSRPLRDPVVVRRLFAEKVAALSSLDPGFGFDLVRLAVRETAPLGAQQEGFGASADTMEAIEALVDRLATRFGGAQVQRLVDANQHLPEAACRALPAQAVRGWSEALAALEAQAFAEPRGSLQDKGEGGVYPAAGPLEPERRPVERAAAPASSTPGARRDGSGTQARNVLSWPGGAVTADAPPPSSPPAHGGESGTADAGPGGTGADEPDKGSLEVRARSAHPRSLQREGRERQAAPLGRAEMGAQGSIRVMPENPEVQGMPEGGAREAAARRGAARSGFLGSGEAGAGKAADGQSRRGPGGLFEDEAPDLAGPARPLRLLEPPEPVEAVAEVPDGPPIRFRWRRVLHQVVRAEGPERIAAPWWGEGFAAPTRDYFRVETPSGQRFWLFRAGLYGHGADAPAWFLHGLFG